MASTSKLLVLNACLPFQPSRRASLLSMELRKLPQFRLLSARRRKIHAYRLRAGHASEVLELLSHFIQTLA